MDIRSIAEIKPTLFSKFDCGVNELNVYLKQFAKKNDKLCIGRSYVLIEGMSAIGFYTISMAQIDFKSLPEQFIARLPKYPIPVARIGRLAIDKDFQGKGFGEKLLMDALSRTFRVSKEIALFAVVVDAKNSVAKDFYLKYGFYPLSDNELSLFLPITTLQKI